ncbi:MAG TPA: 50S ribosomal protein L35 [bacterium]|nr:50S ribosomal protein L35 [bacterium]
MVKMKTVKAASKRFKKSGTGKLMRWHACKSHILTKKSKKRKRNLRQDVAVDPGSVKQVQRMLPHL